MRSQSIGPHPLNVRALLGVFGRIVATGTPEQIAANPASITGRYLEVDKRA